jgi:hypothetical protein
MGTSAKTRHGRPVKREVIARRILEGEPPSRRRYEVCLFGPEPVDSSDWRCGYHISGIRMRSPRYAFGVDAFQALIMALEGIRHDLKEVGSTWTWLGGEAGDLGFPRHVTIAFGPTIARRIDRLIDREVLQYSKMLAGKARRRTKRRAK